MTEDAAAGDGSIWTRLRDAPISVRLYLVAAVALGSTALYGGGNLIADPTGGSLAMDTTMLDGTPFASFLVPGLVLFTVLGIGSLVTVVLIGLHHRMEWVASLGLAVALIGWITVQVALLGGVHWLHVLYGGLGVAMTLLSLAPSMRADLGT